MIKGAIVNIKDAYGNTPLHKAATKEIAELLIEKGADKSLKNNAGKFSVDYAKTVEMAEMLIPENYIAPMDSYEYYKNKEFTTPLHTAVEQGNDILAKALAAKVFKLKTYSDEAESILNRRDLQGRTPLFIAVEKGNKDLAEFFISKGADVNIRNRHNGYGDYTPLHRAARFGNIEIAKLLIDNGANINLTSEYGNTVLDETARWGHKEAVDFFLQKGLNVSRKTMDLACQSGKKEVVDKLLPEYLKKNKLNDLFVHYMPMDENIIQSGIERGIIDVNGNYQGQTPLNSAIASGSKEQAKYLLHKNADIKDIWESYSSIDPEITDLLISKGVNTDKLVNMNVNASRSDLVEYLVKEKGAKVNGEHLLKAVSQEDINLNLVRNLVSLGTDINYKNKDGLTPLFQAISQNRINTDLIKQLISLDADINCKNKNGKTPLDLCISAIKNSSNLESYLEKKDQVYNEKLSDLISHMISKGANVTKLDAYYDSGLTPLHLAVQIGNSDLTKLLLLKKANLNAATENGLTPLLIASRQDNREIINKLINNGANINCKNKDGQTPLFYVKSKDIAEILINNGAIVNEKDKIGRTPLFSAISNNNEELIEYLVLKGANIHERSNLGETPITYAIQNASYNIKKLLISKGADIFIIDKNGNTLLHKAVEEHDLKLTKLLLEKGLSPNITNVNGKNALAISYDNRDYYSSRSLKDLQFRTLLLEKGANPNFEFDSHGDIGSNYTPLIKEITRYSNDHKPSDDSLISSPEQQLDYIKSLILKGANVNAKDSYGNTPLHHSRYYKNLIKLLLENGADVNAKNNDGKTVLDELNGIIYPSQDIIDLKKYLKSKGAKRTSWF